MKWITLLSLVLVFSCGKGTIKKSSSEKQNIAPIYSSSQIKVNVFYEPGAEPYADTLPVQIVTLSIWELLQRNLEALFQGRSPAPAVSVPKTLSEMTQISARNKMSWSLEEVMSLADSLSVPESTGTTNFKVIFLKGYAQEGATIIGFNISNTKIIAIFKDVIRTTGEEDTFVPKYVEQATIIHEMGHALGLVNNGLPMTADHHDSAHGAHCSNPKCVMYYMNEGSSSMISYINEVIKNQSIIMFDSQCLSDARNYQK